MKGGWSRVENQGNTNLQTLCEQSLLDTYRRLEEAGEPGSCVSPAPEHMAALAAKLRLLPEEDRFLLLFRYQLGGDMGLAGALLGLSHSLGRVRYLTILLSHAVGLPEGTLLDDASLEEATRALVSEPLPAEGEQEDPAYSLRFRRALRSIPAVRRQTKGWAAALQGVAVAAAVFVVGFTATLAVSADMRERFFRWAVTTFPTHSTFETMDVEMEYTEENREDLHTYGPTYIPEGFELTDVYQSFSGMMYVYSKGEETLSFHGSIPGTGIASMDTEDTEITEFIFKGEPAYTWVRRGTAFLVWKQDGYEFFLIGGVDQEELLEIGRSVVRNAGLTEYETPEFRRLRAIKPTYTPEGSQVMEEYDIYPVTHIRYFIPDSVNFSFTGRLIPQFRPEWASDLGYARREIAGKPVYYREEESNCGILWEQEGFEFNLESSDLDCGELIKMAESIIRQESEQAD